jgi:hypothetical protein
MTDTRNATLRRQLTTSVSALLSTASGINVDTVHSFSLSSLSLSVVWLIISLSETDIGRVAARRRTADECRVPNCARGG